jgi:hypothetical protein
MILEYIYIDIENLFVMLLMIILNQIIITLLLICLFYSSPYMIIQNPNIAPFMQKIKFYLLNMNKFRITLSLKNLFILVISVYQFAFANETWHRRGHDRE